jgi:hypothetical protein
MGDILVDAEQFLGYGGSFMRTTHRLATYHK